VSESQLVRDILLAFGAIPGIRLFRNNVGRLQDRKGHWVQYGLCVGSSDIIGWHSGRFVALEVKSATGSLTKEQAAFIEAVRRDNGIAACVRSVDEVATALSVPLPPSHKRDLPKGLPATDRGRTP
jgi:hypothetical protein